MSGGIFKDKLIYDSTTPADGDSVASFLHTAAGALTSTGAAGALDVNITNALSVDIDGFYDVGTNPIPDTVGLIAHERNTSDETGLLVRLTGDSPDQDGLVPSEIFASDVNSFLLGWDGVNWNRIGMTDDSLHVTLPAVADDAADAGLPIKIGSRAVSGALTAVSATNDRADLLSDLYRRVWVNSTPNIAGANAAVSIDDTAGGVAVFASPSAGRRRVMVQNLDNKPIYLGFGTVTVSNGIKVNAGATWTEELGPDLALKAITDTGVTADVRVMQLA